MNKIIPKNATLYCFNCMVEQTVSEGEVRDGKLPIYCDGCKKQISELIYTGNGWQLHECFYRSEEIKRAIRRLGEGQKP